MARWTVYPLRFSPVPIAISTGHAGLRTLPANETKLALYPSRSIVLRKRVGECVGGGEYGGSEVYAAVTTPEGLDAWWTDRSSGQPTAGTEYQLWFGPAYDWRAIVRKAEENRLFELELTNSSDDWLGTRVGFELERRGDQTQVRFYHADWAAADEHYRISSFCWAMYLRIMKRWVERGEVVPYRDRLDA